MAMTNAAIMDKFGRRRDGFYHLPEGRKYPSVTTILSVLAKPALIHWAAKTSASLVLDDPMQYDTAEKAAGGIYAARDKAADRGSMVHSLIEALFKGAAVETETMPEHVRGYYAAFWRWVKTVDPKPVYAEATVYNDEFGYAGTTDLVAAFPDKSLRLIDFKTSGAIYRESSLQLEAYRRAGWILPRGTQATPILMPPVSETAIVRLDSDGSFEYRTMNGNFEAFLAAKTLWEWSRG